MRTPTTSPLSESVLVRMDEKLYVRMEDTILVTKDGIENFTAFLASTPDEIEAVMKQEGILSRVPRLP
jgi:Xaa-Pro aminopeptidase